MKRKSKGLSGLIVFGLILLNQEVHANVGDKFNKYVGGEFTNLNGLFIIVGVLIAGIVGKVLHYHFIREKDVEKPFSNLKVSHPRHHRPKPLIKKTS